MPTPTIQRKFAPRRTFLMKHEFIAQLAATGHRAGCVDWPWGVDGRGYAQIWDGAKVRKVSHLVLLAGGRERPVGASALHSCDRPVRVAPWHLRWGSQSENQFDRWARTGARLH